MKALYLRSFFRNALVAQLNRALDYGSRGSGFESLQAHFGKALMTGIGAFSLRFANG